MSNAHFYDLLNTWVATGNTNKFYFIVTKCCGYEFLVPVYKKQTRSDLHFNIGIEHEIPDTFRLYIRQNDMDNVSMAIPSDDIIIKDWINDIRSTIECTTSVPAPVVFRLWMDDGHVH